MVQQISSCVIQGVLCHCSPKYVLVIKQHTRSFLAAELTQRYWCWLLAVVANPGMYCMTCWTTQLMPNNGAAAAGA
jgi:hypothetical protein